MLKRTWNNEQGFSMVVVAVGLAGFVAATTIAIDVGMFMTARSQAQNSADAGALAGATALVFDDYADRSPSGPAVQSAVMAAAENQVMSKDVWVTPEDVTFLPAPSGGMDRVRVQVYRDATHENALNTLMGIFFGVSKVNINAVAVAEAVPANAVMCAKPFMIPDRWIENQTPPWDMDDTFEMYDNKGNLRTDRDIYIPADQEGYTGYDNWRDRGTLLILRAGTGNNIVPSMYFSWDMDQGAIGGDYYRDNIANCSWRKVHWGDDMIQEPGDMMGPTSDGIDTLIAKDPNAYWDPVKREVHTDIHPTPRIFPIPLYDPAEYAGAKQNGRVAQFKVANWIGFFLEKREGNQIYGRICPILGVVDPNAGPAPAGSFARAIRLVQ